MLQVLDGVVGGEVEGEELEGEGEEEEGEEDSEEGVEEEEEEEGSRVREVVEGGWEEEVGWEEGGRWSLSHTDTKVRDVRARSCEWLLVWLVI